MSKLSDEQNFARLFYGLATENPLGAREYPLDAYGQCWCNSGRKWKFCHKIRKNEKRLTFGQLLSLMKKRQDEWVEKSHFCLHPSASPSTCSSSIINSHTVQRNGALSALAEDNHVMSTKKGFFNIEKNNGDIVPARIGLKDASTFPGFCNIHDTKMFLPAEGPDATLNEENAFLLSFRSVAYEYVMKQFAIVNYAVNRDNADKGAPFIKQVATQSLIDGVIKGTRMAIADINRWKIKYDAAYNKRDYSGFNAYMMAFDSVLPFIGAGAFMPEFDFEGNKLQHLGTTTGLEHLAVNVTVLGGVTVAVFGWWLDTSKVIDRFVESFAKLPEGQKASALTTCLFEHLENVYYRQSWWEGLTDSERVSLDELTRGGIYSRSPFSLSNRDLRVNAGVTKILDLRRN